MIYQVITSIEFWLEGISHTASYVRLWMLSEVLWNMTLENVLGAEGVIGSTSTSIVFVLWSVLAAFILCIFEVRVMLLCASIILFGHADRHLRGKAVVDIFACPPAALDGGYVRVLPAQGSYRLFVMGALLARTHVYGLGDLFPAVRAAVLCRIEQGLGGRKRVSATPSADVAFIGQIELEQVFGRMELSLSDACVDGCLGGSGRTCGGGVPCGVSFPAFGRARWLCALHKRGICEIATFPSCVLPFPSFSLRGACPTL